MRGDKSAAAENSHAAFLRSRQRKERISAWTQADQSQMAAQLMRLRIFGLVLHCYPFLLVSELQATEKEQGHKWIAAVAGKTKAPRTVAGIGSLLAVHKVPVLEMEGMKAKEP